MSPKAEKRGDMNNQDSRNVRGSGGSIGGGELLHKVGKKNKEDIKFESKYTSQHKIMQNKTYALEKSKG